MPTVALVLLCILAYVVVGIAVAAIWECLGQPAFPGMNEAWEPVDRGMFIGMWPFLLCVHLICFIMRGPMFIAEGLSSTCVKRKRKTHKARAWE